ncbi:MAG: peptidylprolyl isomerase [Lentilitoribacter sp.]
MGYFKYAAGLATALTIMVAPMQVSAQDASDKVILKFDGAEIRQSDFDLFQELDPQFEQLQGAQKQLAILSALIDVKSLAKKATADKMDQDAVFQKRLEFLKDRSLHNAYFQKNVIANISDEEVKARFEKEIAAIEPEQELRARHILVKTAEEANAIIAELDGGADFVELAKTKSTGPSGPQGGDLGFFGKGQMVPPFEAAAFALEAGAYTKAPVQTQFGFHVIKLEEKRDRPLPKFEEVQDQMRQVVLRERYLETVKEARSLSNVEILDEELKASYEKIQQQ